MDILILPDDVLTVIFGHLTSENRALICKVCKRFTSIAIAVTITKSECPYLYINPDYKIRIQDFMSFVEYADYHELSRRRQQLIELGLQMSDLDALLMKAFESGNITMINTTFSIGDIIQYPYHCIFDFPNDRPDNYQPTDTSIPISNQHMISMCVLGCTIALKYLHSQSLLHYKFDYWTLSQCMYAAYDKKYTEIEDIIAEIMPDEPGGGIGMWQPDPPVDKLTDETAAIHAHNIFYKYPGICGTLSRSKRLPWHDDVITAIGPKFVIYPTRPLDVLIDPNYIKEFCDYAEHHLGYRVYEYTNILPTFSNIIIQYEYDNESIDALYAAIAKLKSKNILVFCEVYDDDHTQIARSIPYDSYIINDQSSLVDISTVQ